MVSSNNVTITEADGFMRFEHASGRYTVIDPSEVAALRAHFAAEQKGDYHEGLEEGIKIGRAERMPEDVQELVAQERAWREGYYTGKRDYAGSVTGGVPISTPNPYAEQLEAAYSQKGLSDDPR